jgi:hypothetical protein
MPEEPKATPDWSRAPTDAQFWGPKKHDLNWNEGWYKQDKNGRWMFCHTGAHSWTGSSLDNTTPERRKARIRDLTPRPGTSSAFNTNDVTSWWLMPDDTDIDIPTWEGAPEDAEYWGPNTGDYTEAWYKQREDDKWLCYTTQGQMWCLSALNEEDDEQKAIRIAELVPRPMVFRMPPPDWTKAPEGTTHYLYENSNYHACWVKILPNGDVYAQRSPGTEKSRETGWIPEESKLTEHGNILIQRPALPMQSTQVSNDVDSW